MKSAERHRVKASGYPSNSLHTQRLHSPKSTKNSPESALRKSNILVVLKPLQCIVLGKEFIGNYPDQTPPWSPVIPSPSQKVFGLCKRFQIFSEFFIVPVPCAQKLYTNDCIAPHCTCHRNRTPYVLEASLKPG